MTRVLLATLLLTAMAQATTAVARESSRTKTVLVLGDSLSAGFRLRPGQAWPALLTERLRNIDPRFEVVNASVSGSTSAGGLRRLSVYLDRRVDILIVELGINDTFLSIPVEEIRRNLQTIIDKVRAKTPDVAVIIAGMQFPISGTDDDYVVAFGKMFGQLAKENQAALVPYLLQGVGGNPMLNLEDRIHPNAAGHKILAQNVWRVLEPVAREVAGRGSR
jgi:acyl-CoA thioesterase I